MTNTHEDRSYVTNDEGTLVTGDGGSVDYSVSTNTKANNSRVTDQEHHSLSGAPSELDSGRCCH